MQLLSRREAGVLGGRRDLGGGIARRRRWRVVSIYLARQAGVIGAGLNGLSFLYGLGSYLYSQFDSTSPCVVP